MSVRHVLTVVLAHWFGMPSTSVLVGIVSPGKKNSKDIFQWSHFSAVTFSQTVRGMKTKAIGIICGGEMEF